MHRPSRGWLLGSRYPLNRLEAVLSETRLSGEGHPRSTPVESHSAFEILYTERKEPYPGFHSTLPFFQRLYRGFPRDPSPFRRASRFRCCPPPKTYRCLPNNLSKFLCLVPRLTRASDLLVLKTLFEVLDVRQPNKVSYRSMSAQMAAWSDAACTGFCISS